MPEETLGEIDDEKELNDDGTDPVSKPEDIEDFVDIDDVDQEYRQELDFADEVFIDNFEFVPPEDE